MRLNRCVPATLTALVLAVLLAFGSAARAQVLEQVPAEALVVMKVTNLQATSEKLAKLCTELGVAQMAPQMADPLGALQAHLKISNGLDKAGDMVFAFIDPAVTGGDEDKSMLMLWPVTDFKAFQSNFPDAREEDGLSVIKFGDNPGDGYLANWGKYAVITPSKEVAKLSPKGIKFAGATAKEMNKDMAVWANMPKLREIGRPKLKENREKIVADLENQMSQDPDVAKFAPVIKAAANRFIDLADQFMAETDAAVYSVNLADAGIATAVVADFAPSSALGSGVKSLKNTNTSLLSGLPDGKYMFFAGALNEPEVSVKAISSLTDPILKEMDTVGGEQATASRKYVDLLKKYYGALKGSTAGMVSPSGQLGQDALIQVVAVQWGDVATLKSSYNEMILAQNDLMKAFAGADAADATKSEMKPAAKTLDGVAFDVTTTTIPGAGPGGAMQQQMMQWMYGPNGPTVMTGQVGDKMLMGVGVPDAVLSSAITAVKGNQNPLSQVTGVKTVAAQLPQQRLAEFYVPLDQVVTTLANAAGAMGMNVQMQLPPDLPPIGGTVSTDGTAIRLDSYTPTELVKALVAAGMQTYMQMQGGRQPGGPGGL